MMRKRLSKSIAALVLLLAGASLVAGAGAAPGKLDPGFGNGGVVVTAAAPDAGEDGQNGLAIQRDGRLIVGGSSDMGAAAGGHQWRISRYTREGVLDRSFGTCGTVTTSMSSAGGFDEHVWNLALDRQGRIVAAGDAVTMTGGFDVALARFNPDGALDTSFGTAGKVTTCGVPKIASCLQIADFSRFAAFWHPTPSSWHSLPCAPEPLPWVATGCRSVYFFPFSAPCHLRPIATGCARLAP